MSSLSHALKALALIAPFMTAGLASAETHTVLVGPGFDFTPADLAIQVGDTVLWDWAGGFHNVESGVDGVHDGNFRSGDATSDTNTTFEVTFDQDFLDSNPMPGNVYPYYCIVHVGAGMVGSITVEPAPCLQDLSGDGQVGIDDLIAVINNWGPCPVPPAECIWDVQENPDGNVGIEDLIAVINAWGGCP